MNELPPYPAYKPTAIPWLQQVPEHWDEMKVKYIFRERVQKGYPNEPLLAATQSKGVVTKEAYGLRTVEAQKDLHLLKLVEKGDFVISLRSFQGGIEVSYARGIISPAYTILRTARPCDPGYLKFLLKAAPFIDGLKLFITGIREGQNIDYVRLARTPLPWPSVDEQHLIVRYLHALDAKVKRYIRTKRTLIARLQEQKQAIIQRAVTRGLDPKVKLKPSGVEWLGEVPVHWEVLRVKQVSKWVTKGTTPTTGGREFVERGINFVKVESITKTMTIDPSMCAQIDNETHRSQLRSQLALDDVLVTIAGAIGRVAVVHEAILPANTNQAVGIIRIDKSKVKARWLAYALRSELAQDQFALDNVQSAQANLSLSNLGRTIFTAPPMEEQERICGFLDNELKQFDNAVSRVEKEISVMLEYHTRLIADVVTGAVDVREAAKAMKEEAPVAMEEELEIETEVEEEHGTE
jgi:type I restriction enzyme S subunit